MKALDKQKVPKRPIDLTINSDLQTPAKELNIDLSSTLEASSKQALSGRHERQWKTENRTAVKAYNGFVENNGCFSDEYRDF